MRNVGKKTVVMFSEFKERQIVKLIFSVVFFVVLLGMKDNVQADEVSTFEDLKEKLTVSESSEVTIVLNNENDIILSSRGYRYPHLYLRE